MHRISLPCRFALFAALAAISAIPGFGQAFYGSVVGTVTDPSGGALTGAAVTLTNAGTGERRQALSGSGGDYQFLNLVPGAYRVQVEQSGFKRAARENLEVNVSGTVRADISLQLGDVTQTVEVQAAAPLLRTEDANLSQVVSARAIEDLPVNGRNILNLGTGSRRGAAGHHRWKRDHRQIFSPPELSDRRRRGEPGCGLHTAFPPIRARESGEHGAEPGRDCEFRVQTKRPNPLRGRDQYLRGRHQPLHGSAYEYFRNDVERYQLRQREYRQAGFQAESIRLNGAGLSKRTGSFLRRMGSVSRPRGSPYIATVPLPEMYT